MTSFEDLGIQDKLVNAIHDMGWSEPTPIQAESVPAGLTGRDIFAQAQTGTGKTGAYAMIVMGRVPTGCRKPAALILAPTRELANQVDEEIYKLSKYTHHRSVAIYGGASINDQVYKLRRGIDIVVGTPGRVKDLMMRGSLDLSAVTEVVLDEADRMLDMGFSEELDFIMDAVPKERQTLLLSATMANEIKRLSMRFMKDPLEIMVSKDEPCSDLTAQYYVQVSRGGKRERLEMILENGNPKTIVFCQTKKMVDMLMEDLSYRYKVDSIHGDMPQAKREKVMRNYRNDKFNVLIATDVAARGLDVNNIEIVVNYDVPPDAETYLHRIGRTGRAGREGVAISFVTKMEDNRIRMYERETGKRIQKIRLEDMAPIERRPVETMVVEEKPAVVKVKTVPPKETKDRMVAIQVNLGRDDGLGRVQVSEFIKSNANIADNLVGRVGLGNSMSYVEIDGDCLEAVVGLISECRFKDKKVFVQMAPSKVPYSVKDPKKAVRQSGVKNGNPDVPE